MDTAKSEIFVKTLTGKVKHFKGSYGFIVPDDTSINDVFVHFTDIEPWREGFKDLKAGEVVKFDLYKLGDKVKAKNVEVKRDKVDMDDFQTKPSDNYGNTQ